jgi:exoribonuclease-2
MGRGEYVLDLPGVEPPGHFGLAVKDYTHATAPNRRFPDLITQRLLKAALVSAPPPYTIPELEELAKHCTSREDDATKIERRVRKSAAALLLSDRIGEQFDAIVTGASSKGTWVRLCRPPVEGKLERGFAGLDVGDRVRVKLIHTDVSSSASSTSRETDPRPGRVLESTRLFFGRTGSWHRSASDVGGRSSPWVCAVSGVVEGG